MANNAYIHDLYIIPDKNDLFLMGKSLCENQFKGLMKVEEGEEGYFIITPSKSENPYFGVEYYLSTLKLEDRRLQPAICVRHGHLSNLGWWMDRVFCNASAQRFGGLIWDEGVGPMERGSPNLSFKEYLVDCFGLDLSGVEMATQTFGSDKLFETSPELRAFLEGLDVKS